MVKVSSIRRTCFAYPAQWEGKAESRYVYVRYRRGYLRVGLGPTIEDAVAADPIFEWDSADGLDGFMDYGELKHVTAGVLDLPEKEDPEDQQVQDTTNG